MRRNLWISLIGILVVAFGALAATFALGNSPQLGLDLQGGISVVMLPKQKVGNSTLNQTIKIIRNRVDALGVAEPDISRQGKAVVVQLPGVKNRDRALQVVGQTAELRFRPVIATIAIPGSTTTTKPKTTSTTQKGATTSTTAKSTSTSQQGMGLSLGESAAGPLQTPTTAAPPASAPPTSTLQVPTAPQQQSAAQAFAAAGCPNAPAVTKLTTADGDLAKDCVVLPDRDNKSAYILGPAPLTGRAISTARAELNQNTGEWAVRLEMKSSGIDGFNQIAGQCYAKQSACPTGQLANVLDHAVVIAPTIQAQTFKRDQIQITGNFSEKEAKDIALVLRYGALPVELVPQQVQTVSATLGRDALKAGVAAGIVGLGLVALYMIFYYRLLGVVAVVSLSTGAALLWAIVAYLGESRGLALTLAGVTGIIVSIGVAVDSNVVFYEHLKEDVWRGRTLRSSVEGSFVGAFRTIVKADLASLIGAFLLYWLTVGPVRGFAFYLGLSTILDLVASYFVMRPLVVLMARSPRLHESPRLFGLGHVRPPEATAAGVTA